MVKTEEKIMGKPRLVVRKIPLPNLRQMSRTALIKRDDRLSVIDFRLRERRKSLPRTHHVERRNLTKRINRAGNERKKISKVLKEKRKAERLKQDLDVIARSVRRR